MSSALTRLGLDRAAMPHGPRLSLAAWPAFCLALPLHIPNPHWAAMPVWVVAQAQRGLDQLAAAGLVERVEARVMDSLIARLEHRSQKSRIRD